MAIEHLCFNVKPARLNFVHINTIIVIWNLDWGQEKRIDNNNTPVFIQNGWGWGGLERGVATATELYCL